ncbi:N-acetyltransferase [Catenulispora acidiphila DSM 44928]|uniref:N-acetyltransferase n=1 Tax=Catenulispora acidiphila (strain DSM 44928 / JCM 14897 / NBRC 102108 / NRRL B-24433 / ID139908) TaxID=479433 RepID=C7Q3U6_CATAD|nr:arylamine N-acetyltransferase [Catenulispora acidiphila]ACU77704.1 N-acetyltransferase [Catenulispora acidiphila DSM 44928]
MDFDLDAYLARIGYTGERTATAATLGALQRTHIYAIPFENLDPVRGVVPSLDLDDLTAKLVHGTTRGGYCYEHNTLYAAALRALGFQVTVLAGRVLVGAKPGDQRPRTHMLLLAETPDDPHRYLTDVGFGSEGALLDPMPLAPADVRDQPRHHRLSITPADSPLEQWVLRAFLDGQWRDQYSFTVEPFYAPDFGVINYYIASSPRSPFSSRVYACRTYPDRQLKLDARAFTVTQNDGTSVTRDLADDAEVRQVLADEFGIVAPPQA